MNEACSESAASNRLLPEQSSITTKQLQQRNCKLTFRSRTPFSEFIL